MKNTHKVSFRVNKQLYNTIKKQSNTIASSIRVLLQLALEGCYYDIFDPSVIIDSITIKYHLTTRIDPFINDMIEEYSSINNVSKSDAVIRLILITKECEGLK